MKLLVDIGNTRIKWCVEHSDQIEIVQTIAYKETDLDEALHVCWSKIAQPQILAISSVSSKHVIQKLLVFANEQWPDIVVVIAKSSAQMAGVKNAYHDAEKLGVDRWLALIALQYYYPGHGCVVDCGTAITIDCLDEAGQHLGGLISPGLALMRQSLFQQTEALGFDKQTYAVGLANQTEAAIYTGVLYAVAGLIEKAVTNLMLSPSIILTGGDAPLVASNLSLETKVDSDLVLKGLSLYCKEVVSV